MTDFSHIATPLRLADYRPLSACDKGKSLCFHAHRDEAPVHLGAITAGLLDSSGSEEARGYAKVDAARAAVNYLTRTVSSDRLHWQTNRLKLYKLYGERLQDQLSY